MKAELEAFEFSAAEQGAIAVAMATAKPWEQAGVAEIRKRIKLFHLELNEHVCCYCQRDLKGEFNLVIDVEHVLPSSKFKPQTFEIWNLSASCKRCNMHIKKADVTFLEETGSLLDPARYKLAHPNFDIVEEHLVRLAQQVGRARIVKYMIKTAAKGQYTYDYFRLLELETNSYDEAQGANLTDPAHPLKLEIMRSRVEALRAQTTIAQHP
jgi:hypothetical protein